MMIEPSIDKLLDKTDNNRYVLCTLIAKRAKEIESIRRLELADTRVFKWRPSASFIFID